MNLIITPTQMRDQLQIALDGITAPYAAMYDTYGSSTPPGSVAWETMYAMNIAATTLKTQINALNEIIGRESRA